MPKAYLAYYSDVVFSASGVAVVGAKVYAFSTGQFAAGTLPTGATGLPTPVALTMTDASGRFAFAALPPDDYHILVTYTQLGGTQQVVWSYHQPVVAADLVRRAVASARASGLPRALGRLLAGSDVTIFCAGDDVTVGYDASGTVSGGWVALLAAQLAALYPSSTVLRWDPASWAATSDGPIPSWTSSTLQTGTNGQTIQVVNGGVKGDTVLRFLRRFANLTYWPATDVVIAAFGLWDSTTGAAQQVTDAAGYASNLESLVNVVRTATQAEVLLCTPHANPPSANSIDDYANAARSVAARLQCDLADIRQLWLDCYLSGGPSDGYYPWLSSGTSRVFPTDAGHAAIAGEIAKHFSPAVAVPFERGGYGAGKTWELVRVPYSSSQVAISGTGWALHGAGWQGKALTASGDEYVTSHTGDTVTIQGRFVDVSMLCRRFSDCGQVSVAVDGGAATLIDLYRAYPASTSDLGDANGASAPQDRVLLAHGLTDAVHTVVVTHAGTKNAASSGYAWRFDALELGRWRRQGFEVEANDPQQRLQRGVNNVTLSGTASGTAVVAFPTAFTGQTVTPTVVAASTDANYFAVVSGVGNSGFTLGAVRRDGTNVSATVACDWIALG